MEHALFIFRRDLRLSDNTGLIYALKNAKKVSCCFIFTPEQIENNPYRSERCLQFMLDALDELEKQIHAKGGKLYYFFGKPHEVVEQCLTSLSIDAVIVNRDYTPYSTRRDLHIGAVCDKRGVEFSVFDDALLHPPETTLKKDGTPYLVFTPFFKNGDKLDVAPPQRNPYKNYNSAPIAFAKKPYTLAKKLPYHTSLSAQLKFTTRSVREIYHKMPDKRRALHWRDFFTGIAHHFPHVFGSAFYKKYDKVKWSTNKTHFTKWCTGETGFPIVDAAMRELNATGFIDNRWRMVVASFLTKDLHIDWRLGEKYFAQTLVDYDPAVNNGNWQWVAGTGCDAAPYFRVFNPWTQAEKFDPQGAYRKKWLPASYALEPMVDHSTEAKRAVERYQAISKS